ncbi:PREDICTED: mas-related G-protein coupled receptor member X2-like [Elephantulus edwardii]|uniref:mas-related G-protein coupled receptor member X2-like n=1 Tax=Elephantulus edwardii TaxID=28737 RepID=UPI0003F0583B|nr:PREDICTED: mas-related G-protein coupled receptor member X2-like [Elephantulus edwardii]
MSSPDITKLIPGLVCVPRDNIGEFLSMNPTIPAWGIAQTTMNGGYEPSPPNTDYLEMEPLIFQILTLIIAAVGLLANGAVIWILGFRLKRNFFSVYILNLAVADFFYLFLEFIFHLIYFISIPQDYIWIFFIRILCNLLYVVDLSILSCISTEHCLSVLFPIWYRCRRPRHTSAVTCALLWTWSLLLIILQNMPHFFDSVPYTEFFIFFATWLSFLFVTLLVSNMVLLAKMFYGFLKKLTRFNVTILLTVFISLLCLLPVNILQYFYLFTSIPVFGPWIPLLTCINSTANPVIYFFVGSFRQRLRVQRVTLKMVLQRALQDTPDGEEPGESLPQESVQRPGTSEV